MGARTSVGGVVKPQAQIPVTSEQGAAVGIDFLSPGDVAASKEIQQKFASCVFNLNTRGEKLRSCPH